MRCCVLLVLLLLLLVGVVMAAADTEQQAYISAFDSNVLTSQDTSQLCIIRQPCARCPSFSSSASPSTSTSPSLLTTECRRTGYVQHVECFDRRPSHHHQHQQNSSSSSSTVRIEACDSSAQLLDFFQFTLACLVVAAVALFVVRARKQAARQSLVQLVNRS